jgi:pyruvate dehydrogenase E2 component (dihydrolipoamide acetyltransferase)
MAEVTLPQLGETVTEGTITRWFKKVGDTVAADEALFEVSTDKVDTEVPSPVAGTLVEIRAAEGDTVPVGTVLAVVTDGAAPAAPPAPEVPAAPEAAAPAPEPQQVPPPPAPPVAPPPTSPAVAAPAAPVAQAAPAAEPGRILSPVVRRLVNEHGLDPASIPATGPGGRITREDVLAHIDSTGSTRATGAPVASPAPVPAVAAPAPVVASTPGPVVAPAVPRGDRDRIVPLSKIRQLTGAHMVMSKSVAPHAFSVVEVDYANVERTRSAAKEAWRAQEGFGLTALPFIARAVVDALADFPHLNASIDGTDLVVHQFVDLGIAVDLDGEGLLVPVVRSAETKRMRGIAREIRDLADRARARRLSPDEIQGGTFTISNNGSAGSVLTMAVINQPQVAILSTDAIVRKPVVVDLPDGGEAIVVHPVGHLAMSWDHRAFDGAYAAGFLVRVKEILETRDWSSEV